MGLNSGEWTLRGAVRSKKISATKINHKVNWQTAEPGSGKDVANLVFVNPPYKSDITVTLTPLVFGGFSIPGYFQGAGVISLINDLGATIKNGTFSTVVTNDGSLVNAIVSWNDSTTSGIGLFASNSLGLGVAHIVVNL